MRHSGACPFHKARNVDDLLDGFHVRFDNRFNLVLGNRLLTDCRSNLVFVDCLPQGYQRIADAGRILVGGETHEIPAAAKCEALAV